MADEKKRIIDLSELSQEVQVGQYILVDSASGPGKMNLKKIVDDSTTSLAERVTDLETGLTEEENARIAADTELSGNVSNLQTALETKADNDGYYPDLYAGNLSSTRKQTDSIPYIMRKTGGDLSRIGEREHDTLVGATVNVNQLIAARTRTITANGVTATENNDGSITLNGTSTSSGVIDSLPAVSQTIDHVYYLGVSGSSAKLGYSNIEISASFNQAIKRATASGFANVGIRSDANVTYNNLTISIICIDLTAMFGSTIADYLYSLETATAGAGIAKLREWGFLTDEYIPYNAGSLESVEATAHKMVGFNQFDKSTITDNAYVSGSTGSVQTGQSEFFCSDFIPCLPNTQYYSNADVNARIYTHVFYDADKNYISANATANGTFTTPSTAYYMRANCIKANRAADAFCINLSNPDRNGEYEPYSAHTYNLGTDTLRGLFKLDSENRLYADGDTKTSDGVVTRKYTEIDLGTLNWRMSSTASRFYARISPTYVNVETSTLLTGKYTYDGYGNSVLGYYGDNLTIRKWGYGTDPASAEIYIHDDAYTDAATFKTAMSGVMLVYELATPTTETSTPFQNPQICDPDGTEEYVTSNGVPVGHVTEYDYDIKGLAEELIDVPDVPSSNGTYVLKATRTANGLTYSWVAG